MSISAVNTSAQTVSASLKTLLSRAVQSEELATLGGSASSGVTSVAAGVSASLSQAVQELRSLSSSSSNIDAAVAPKSAVASAVSSLTGSSSFAAASSRGSLIDTTA